MEEFREEDGFHSDCATLRMIEVETKEECMNATCGLGGTVFNYKSGKGRSRLQLIIYTAIYIRFNF